MKNVEGDGKGLGRGWRGPGEGERGGGEEQKKVKGKAARQRKQELGLKGVQGGAKRGKERLSIRLRRSLVDLSNLERQ